MLAGEVSNTDVGGRIALTLLLLTPSLIAQKSKARTDTTIIARAKQALISRFDPALPNLSLESFLKYETGDPSIDWQISDCNDSYTGSRSPFNDGRCVTAYSSLSDARVITVSVRVLSEASAPPALISVWVIAKGLQTPIRLIEVPAVAQGARPLGSPRHGPRDLLPLSRVA